MSRDPQECERLREELAAWIEGELSPAAAAHLADCDECRDWRHDAAQVARRVANAGADHVAPPPDELAARVLAALDARGAQSPRPDLRVVSATPVPEVPQSVVPPVSAPPVTPVVQPQGRPVRALPPVPRYEVAHETASPMQVAGRRRAAWVLGGGLMLTAAAAAAVLVAMRETKTDSHVAAVATSPWQAHIARVVRASREASGGVELKRPGASAYELASERTAILPGTHVRTDAKTRVRLEMDDGSVVVLDRATELVIDPSAARSARLLSGSLVADVAHREPEAVARITTPTGPVEVLGTRFALTATDDRTSVRVTRGVVKLGEVARAVEVKTGQEGVLERGGSTSIAPAVGLASAVSWAELTGQSEPGEVPLVGLGELRARRPGSTTERDEAVHLASHQVKVRVVGNMARTEIEEVFRNDTGQELEGVYRFPLPPDAQIEQLSLDVNGRMEPGAFVERDRAAAIWRGVIRHATPRPRPTTEEFVWVPGPWHDPALLEWQRGGRFELRIFPIPAHGSRKVTLSYTQTVAPSGGVRRYVYPLPHDPAGSTRVDQFNVDVQVMGHERARGVRAVGYALQPAAAESSNPGAERMVFAQSGFVPSGDLVLEYAQADRASPLTAWTYQPAPPSTPNAAPEQPYVALALRPTLPRWGESRPRDYVFVVDASRSMVGERFARATRLVTTAVAEMDRRDRFTVLACDTRCETLGGALHPASSEGAQSATAFLHGVEPAGASDLVAQVRAATRAVTADPTRDLRVVYLGDGASTVGYRRPDHLAAEVGALFRGQRATLTAVALGTDADTTALRTLARAGGGTMVPYVPGERVNDAALGLLEATYGVALRDPVIELPAGLTAVAPAKLGSMRAGSETLVIARMNGQDVSGEAVLRGTVDGEAFEARYPLALHATSDAGNAFVPRLYAAARIADLEASGAPTARAEIIDLSQKFRVASRYTSLLVLESAAMFRAFGVERGQSNVDWTGDTASVSTQAPADAARDVMADRSGGEAADEDLAGAGDAALGGLGTRAPARVSAGSGFGRRARSASLGTDDSGMLSQPSAPAASVNGTSGAGGGRVVTGALARPQIATEEAPMFDPWNRGRRGGQWMRRVWERHAAVAATAPDGSPSASLAQRVESARLALTQSPDSRDRHKELFRWLSVAGDLDDAEDIAKRWNTRDPLDIDAIARAADVAARRGDRARSIRLLAGMVDAKPDDVSLHERMATLHERAGELEQGCAYRVAIAEVRPQDTTAVARAVRCERALGRTEAAARMLNDVTDVARRARIEAESVTSAQPATDAAPRGELTVEATWDLPEDLDVVVIDPRGVRLSWQGGRTGITARGVTVARGEGFGLSRLAVGEHLVEIVRTGPARTPGVVRGQVTVRAMDQTRTVSFVLDGERVRVARVNVTREERLVPM